MEIFSEKLKKICQFSLIYGLIGGVLASFLAVLIFFERLRNRDVISYIIVAGMIGFLLGAIFGFSLALLKIASDDSSSEMIRKIAKSLACCVIFGTCAMVFDIFCPLVIVRCGIPHPWGIQFACLMSGNAILLVGLIASLFQKKDKN